jgi:hypothetical protein
MIVRDLTPFYVEMSTFPPIFRENKSIELFYIYYYYFNFFFTVGKNQHFDISLIL